MPSAHFLREQGPWTLLAQQSTVSECLVLCSPVPVVSSPPLSLAVNL